MQQQKNSTMLAAGFPTEPWVDIIRMTRAGEENPFVFRRVAGKKNEQNALCL
jgi:hypothetical protein